MSTTKVIAHRGASAYAPENTLIAFKKAIEMKADGIEFDLHLTKDNELVVCHDEKIDRTTNGMGYIKDLTLKEIKQFDAGSWFRDEFKDEKIPTFEEVLDLIEDKNLLIKIELKNDKIQYEGIEKKTLDVLDKYKVENEIIISSFNHSSLLKVKEHNPDIKTGILFNKPLGDNYEYAKRFKVYSFHPKYRVVTKKLINDCNKYNIPIIPYTINDSKLIKKYADNNLYGLITDYPDKALEIIK